MTSYRYDSAEELTSATSAANDVTRYGYNLAGVLNSLTDPRTKVTSWILDDESRVVQKYFADSTTTFEQTAYEAAISRVTTFTDRVGQTTAYTYNLDNSRYSTTYSNDTNPTSTVYFFYDPAYPRLVQMIDQFSKKSGNTSTWTYYPVQTTQALGANQLETVTRAVPGGGTGNTEDTVTYTYDQLNRVVGTTIDGVAQSVGYDAVGRLKTSTNALDAFTYGYSPNDATARITSVTSTAGPAVAMTYNNATTIPSNELVNQITVSSGTNTLQQFGYTLYDADDNLKTGTLSIPSQSLSNSLSYNYDPANRLLNLTVNSATNPQYVYTPDASSNLTSITTNGTTKNYTYTSTNTITAGTYDANGSPTSLANYGYSWDGANRLIGSMNPSPASSSAFYYDGFGRVVLIVESNSAGTVTAKHAYLWCGNTVCLAHDDLNGGAVSTQYFPQGAIIAGTPYYYIRDRLGSVTALVANGGSVATQYTFDPYGNRTLLSGTVPADIGYAGYFAHAASGLDITMNRFFDPVHGRWLNRDPIGESGGVNLYAYVGGNPTTLTDPSGLCPLWDSFTATDAQAISIQQQIDYLVSQLTRLPDYISFNINAYVGSVFSAFASTGNAFVGGGVNFNAPNPANLEASVNVGWLNTINPSADHIDNFLSSYSGGVTGGYIGVGGGVAWSPGNGTATVIGFGAGESFGTSFKGGSNASWGYSVNTGYTGITW